MTDAAYLRTKVTSLAVFTSGIHSIDESTSFLFSGKLYTFEILVKNDGVSREISQTMKLLKFSTDAEVL